MTENAPKTSFRDRIRWWLYGKCFAYCVRCVYPAANPADFCVLDMANFIAMSKDEVHEIIEDDPDMAWHFESLLKQYQAAH